MLGYCCTRVRGKMVVVVVIVVVMTVVMKGPVG